MGWDIISSAYRYARVSAIEMKIDNISKNQIALPAEVKRYTSCFLHCYFHVDCYCMLHFDSISTSFGYTKLKEGTPFSFDITWQNGMKDIGSKTTSLHLLNPNNNTICVHFTQ